MSAKGRGRHEGGEHDYYPTPAWCVDRLLDDCGDLLFSAHALEPTCGDGAIIRAASAWLERQGWHTHWTGVELRRGALHAGTPVDKLFEGEDFRTWQPPRRFDFAIGNPPYSLAEQIARKALACSDRVALLLRTGFLGSDERVDFWRGVGANPALRVLPDRPSFDGVGSDSATYAWFVWGSSEIQGVHMLDSTPLAVRNAQKPQSLEFEHIQGSLFT